MIRPERDVPIALAILFGGLCLLVFGILRLVRFGDEDWTGSVAVAFGLVAVPIGFFATLNFLAAARRIRAMQRGEEVIAAWTLSAREMGAFVAQEAVRSREEPNRWHMRPEDHAGLKVVFSQDGVLLGAAWHGLGAAGIQRVVGGEVLPGNPVVLRFMLSELAAGPGDAVSSRTVVLRLPVARTATDRAGSVLRHYLTAAEPGSDRRTALAGRVQRVGLGALAFCLVAGGAGWLMAEAEGWRADAPFGFTSLVLMILGALGAPAALAVLGVARLVR